MAEQSQARMLSAAFPTPPPYYKHFTKDNVSRLRQIRKEVAASSQTDPEQGAEAPALDVLALPAELRYLVPPEPPADGRYKSFGADYDLAQPAQSLSAAGIPELYPADATDSDQFDPTSYLQSLTRSILLNYLELVGILSVNPTQGPEKVEHLQHLFYNVHDLINRYRPHQARESLILSMEEQVSKIRADVVRVSEVKQKMSALLKGVEQLGNVSAAQTDAANGTAGVRETPAKEAQHTQSDVWNVLEKELGT
ncbi:hypothetical protein MBLNU459_g8510t1 [Dothideomycetes sp. NU459]